MHESNGTPDRVVVLQLLLILDGLSRIDTERGEKKAVPLPPSSIPKPRIETKYRQSLILNAFAFTLSMDSC